MAKRTAKEIAPRIVVDPDVHFGKAVVKGTRVPVEILLEQLALGASVAQVADEYGVSTEDVLAVLKYAHEIITSEEVRAV